MGVVLLWISDAWNTRDRIIGTLVVPGGLAGSIGVALAFTAVPSSVSCDVTGPGASPVGSCVSHTSTSGTVVPVILGTLVVIAPIATAIHLSWRLRQARIATGTG